MPFNKESFAPMKEEVSELRGIIAEFLSLTDPEESALPAGQVLKN